MTDNTREGVQAVKGGPSEAAVQAACAPVLVTAADWEGPRAGRWPLTEGQARQALDAAHDSALGLDRSVRLGDVVEWLRDPNTQSTAYRLGVVSASGFADLIAREFGANRAE